MIAFATALFGKIAASKIGLAGLSALAGALAIKAPALVRPMIGKFIQSQLSKVLEPNLKDPVEREKLKNLALAAIAYAEYKVPDRGEGAFKKSVAASALTRFLPSIAAQVAGDLIQEAFDSLDDEMKKRLKINQP